MNDPQTNHEKNKTIAAALAFLGALQPTPIPFAGIHKFYLGRYGWGVVYLLLGATQLPRIACAVEGIWYLTGSQFHRLWAKISASPLSDLRLARTATAETNLGETVDAVASSLREIEQLRQEGLLSEYEF
ncbi:MAG: TM2 domain-containing protein, partial [Cyanobacteria bacterium P01_F01_bin.13]